MALPRQRNCKAADSHVLQRYILLPLAHGLAPLRLVPGSVRDAQFAPLVGWGWLDPAHPPGRHGGGGGGRGARAGRPAPARPPPSRPPAVRPPAVQAAAVHATAVQATTVQSATGPSTEW